jgi:chemosensory pili system protein ChpA (sensor histidine kinase/response regulator)
VTRPRVLAVDDDPRILEILKNALEGGGFDARVLADPREACDLAGEFRPDVIILDIAMPHMDGFQVAARVRADAALKDIPLVFLTAWNTQANLRKAQELQAAAYVEKPFQKEAFLGLLKQILSRPK